MQLIGQLKYLKNPQMSSYLQSSRRRTPFIQGFFP